ncbi:hypothetical protein JM946_08200 [Steroidobacter sp. S1-65]|uniref:Uncharacterized protein n=1 Tax=Steroidobacter gossypii TaxID=2805490 RepID=A0ABS1WUS3_9GAMM|nr:hypothetical protein [Steroidobacter gossypii]MBM0104725.1 hypothetical protein [Steroidobacter gossypii]
MQTEAAPAPKLLVSASRADIQAALQAALTPEQLQSIKIEQSPEPENPLLRRRGVDPEALSAVVTFVSGAMAGGMLYDLVKQTMLALSRKLGKDRVREVRPDE